LFLDEAPYANKGKIHLFYRVLQLFIHLFSSVHAKIIWDLKRMNGGDDYMPMAFVLINTETGSESKILAALKRIDAVTEAYMVYGVYDVVVKVRADTMEKLKEIVTYQVRHLDKVGTTTTMLVIE
jgi:DNA-binding Lrp family transcriptional regulator